jgi:hypothetical protein
MAISYSGDVSSEEKTNLGGDDVIRKDVGMLAPKLERLDNE